MKKTGKAPVTGKPQPIDDKKAETKEEEKKEKK
jgi:hypothetical protein